MLVRFLAALLIALPIGQITPDKAAQYDQPVLCLLIAERHLPGLKWPDFSAYLPQIQAFYEPVNYAVAWTRSGVPTDQAKEIIEHLRHADDQGLDPDDYDGARWTDRLVRISQSGPAVPQFELARFDLEVTVSVMRYLSDLHFGRADPGLFHAEFAFDFGTSDLGIFVRQKLVYAANVNSVIDSVEPPYRGYRRTKDALRKYLALVKLDDKLPLPLVSRAVEPNQTYVAADRLAAKLQLLGDLQSNVTIRPNTYFYTGMLADAVKHFQRRHGLEADGRLGNRTIAQLNVPLLYRVRQLQLALERWRWLPHAPLSSLIVVNIPEFKLRALSNGQIELEMKVVAGALQHQTPTFAGNLGHVIFRPYWNVPLSIQGAELVPKLERDRHYFVHQGYQVVDTQGRTLATGTSINDATLAQLRSGRLRVRQVPGDNNALGLIKFVLPNEHNVYLHGTPQAELFSKSRRTFSHGCIRVEKPVELAAWVLRNQPGWQQPRIVNAMNGTKTISVKLDRPIPVLIVYATAIVLENGEEYFFEDIYGEDAKLEQRLIQGWPYRRSDGRRTR